MRFKISLKPEKYDLRPFEGVMVSIEAENDEEDPVHLQAIRDLIPKGFTKVKVESPTLDSPTLKKNTLDIGQQLEPGKRLQLATVLLIALQPGRVSWSPKALLEDKESVIGERSFSIQRRGMEEKDIVRLETREKVALNPGEQTSISFNLKSQCSEKIDYLVLLNALPHELIEGVEGRKTLFQLDDGNLLLLEEIAPNEVKPIEIQFKIKPYDQLRSITTGRIQKKVTPSLIAKTGSKLLKSDVNPSYLFKVSTNPGLLPPTVKFRPSQKGKDIILEHESRKRRELYLREGGQLRLLITLKKLRDIPITGVRVSEFLPKSFEIVEQPENRDLTVHPSLIQLSEMSNKQRTMELTVKAPKNGGKFLISPSISCNEQGEKMRVQKPLLLHVVSEEELQKASISPPTWKVTPKPPITSQSRVNVKLKMQNRCNIPLTNLQVKLDFPQLKVKNVESSPKLEAKEEGLYRDFIKPKEVITVEVSLECPQEPDTGTWTGKCRVNWVKAGNPQHTNVTRKYEIIKKKEKRKKKKGTLEKLKFWDS